MANRTHQPQGQPTPDDDTRWDKTRPTGLTPQPNRILTEPATVQACQQDYADAVGVRQTMAQQDARHR